MSPSSRPHPLPQAVRACLQFGLALSLCAPALALAQSPPAPGAARIAFDIPAQDLAGALAAFGRVSQQQLAYDRAVVAGKRSSALSGSHDAKEGLDLLLAGTGLKARAAGNGVLVIEAPPASGGAQTLDAVIVTGTTAAHRTVLQSSSAITVADQQALDRKAPRSTAQALELIPGMFVEASGGEISNNFSVRGMPGGSQQFVQLSEDGLPVFYTNALADTILKQEVSIDRMEAVRGGTSGILTVNGAGATVNFLTRKPGAEPEGTLRLTTSDFGTRRIDLWQGGPIDANWQYSVGGFYRRADGVRDPGFTGDHGGSFRAAIGRIFERGEFGFTLKLVDDHNTFQLPIPLQDAGDPRGVPGLDATTGTMLSRDNAVMDVRTAPASGRSWQRHDLRDGVHATAVAPGYHFEYDINDGLSFRSKGRYTDFKSDFNSVFSSDNASLVPATYRLDRANFGDIGVLLDRFAAQGAVQAGLRRVNNGEVIAGADALNALNGNGLVTHSITGNNRRDVEEFVNDASLTWQNERNSFTAGLLYFHSRVRDSNIGASTFVSEVRNRPDRMDIVALDAAGNVVGSLTENGLLNYSNWGDSNNRYSADSFSLYLNDEFQATERLRIDGGVRVERYDIDFYEGISTPMQPVEGAFDANGNDVDDIIANNYLAQFGGGAFTGRYTHYDSGFTETAATLGGTYLLGDNFALYARYARGFQANGRFDPVKIDFGEVGVRYQSRVLTASLTGFRTTYKDFLFSRLPPGAATEVRFYSDIVSNGVEFDVLWKPARYFQLQATGVVQRSKVQVNDDQGTGFARLFDGNKPERTPPVNVTVTPSLLLPEGRGEIYVSYHYLDKMYSDIANTLELPGYGVWSAGVTYRLAPKWQLQANLDNLTNEVGLTEGNPRSGFAENSGVSGAFYARPILGRNLLLSLTYDF
ncbi:TonB-dependent receptor [Xanthomonas sp. AM6]|uniref:TonB-dependent siderophore receptor n=1 Tax=Xanthomonas sp. AM6 TaxID=2982531 RepID=UPI0021D7E2A6|nr:TonB-dependent receptor [Xanthomonas sp. AM6]UYB52601.1 TonB-dependent receptor [Xanthomonas sp. AM6]